MRRLLFLMISIILSGQFFFAQKSTVIKLNGEKPRFEVNSLKSSGFTIENSISELRLNPVTLEKENFMTLETDGLAKIFTEGIPNIPVISKLIEVPQGAEVEFLIKSYDEEIIELSDYGITDKIQPALQSLSKSEKEVPFVLDEEVYNTNDYVNKRIAEYEESGMMRYVRLGRIEIHPIQYNPVKNTLRILNNLVIEVIFKNSDFGKTNDLQNRYQSSYYEGMMPYVVINHERKSKDLTTQVPVEYVIVSDRMFETQLEPFIAWKTKKGFHVTVAYTDEIGTTTTTIKAYLQGLYNGATPPSFVLLVGDVAQIPAYTGSHYSDLYYFEYTGDLIPEVFYGRFSANNPTELQPQIDKTLDYEKFLIPEPGYLANNILVAGVDGGYAPTFGNGAINYASTYYCNEEHDINPLTYLYPPATNSTVMQSSESGASASIISYINAGVGLYNYTAHGSTTSFSDPSLTVSNVHALTNDHKYGLLIGNCCLTNSFQVTECFGESLLRKANGGAIGYIGASNSTYWDEDYWWAIGYKNTPVSANPTYEETTTGAYDALFHDRINELDPSTWYITQDQMNVCGNLAVQASTSSRKQYYWEIYHLMGDPSLTTYMGVPTAMTVTPSPATLLMGMTSLNVSSSPYAYVALSQNGVLIAAALSDDSGNATLTFESGDISVGTADLVVTCQNKIPYIGTIMVSPADQPYIVLNTYTTDIAPDYGQTVNLNVTLENVAASGSGYDAANVLATIALTDPYVTINDGTENFGTINAGATSTINGAFQITLADDVPDQHTFSFTMTITGDDAKYTWPGTLTMKGNAPVISIGNLFVTGDDNADGRLDPGETGNINFTISNTGHADAIFNGTLSENDDPNDYLTLGNTTVSNVNISADASVDFSYTGASADINTPLGSPVGLTIDITAGASNQYFASDDQDLIIGLIPIYIISDEGTLTVCTGTFYDSGGETGEYSNSENYTMSFLPGSGEDFIVANFISFETENGYDELTVYDGPNASSPVIGVYDGTDGPGTIMGANGLTFNFQSDGSVTRPGWIAEISCYSATTPPDCAENPVPANNATNVFPISISWGISIGATSYDVYFGTDPDPYTNTPVNVSSTTYDISPSPTTTYYWAVLPVNAIGTAEGCAVWTFTTGSAQYIMGNGEVTTCDGDFYDSGGPNSNYQNYEDYTMTFMPETAGNMIQVEFFGDFQIESCTYDQLTIYDGLDANADQLAQFCGTIEPTVPITATNIDGALTFVFHSDVSLNYVGWSASISCVAGVTTYTITFNVSDGMNPIEDASVYFNNEEILTDASGNAVFTSVPEGNGVAYEIVKTGYATYNGNVNVDSDKTVNVILTPVSIVDLIKRITIVPNPNEGRFQINLGNLNSKNNTLKIYNISGKVIHESNITSSIYNVDISMFANGLYFVELSLDGYKFNSKIIVK